MPVLRRLAKLAMMRQKCGDRPGIGALLMFQKLSSLVIGFNFYMLSAIPKLM